MRVQDLIKKKMNKGSGLSKVKILPSDTIHEILKKIVNWKKEKLEKELKI